MDDFEMDGESRRMAPFPIERWTRLVTRKLQQGYALVLKGDNARLFRSGVGYEPCPRQVVKVLLKDGILELAGRISGGDMYVMKVFQEDSAVTTVASPGTKECSGGRVGESSDSDATRTQLASQNPDSLIVQ